MADKSALRLAIFAKRVWEDWAVVSRKFEAQLIEIFRRNTERVNQRGLNRLRTPRVSFTGRFEMVAVQPGLGARWTGERITKIQRWQISWTCWSDATHHHS